jgi:hypothetical protein
LAVESKYLESGLLTLLSLQAAVVEPAIHGVSKS